MTPNSITNRAMWAVYNPSGDILFGTIGHTKEESEGLFKAYYRLNPALKSEYEFKMIAIDIVPCDAPVK